MDQHDRTTGTQETGTQETGTQETGAKETGTQETGAATDSTAGRGADRRRRRERTIRLTIIAVLAVAGLGSVVWFEFVRYQVIPKNFGVVDEGRIYRSGRLTPRMLEQIVESKDIRLIIDLADGPNDAEEVALEQATADRLGVRRIGLDLVGDGTGDPALYAEAVALMADPANQPVLVHCAAGAQRTSTATIAYRHLLQGVPLKEAYAESFDFKHDPGQDWMLLAYLAEHLDEIEAAIAEARASDANDAGERPSPGPAVAGADGDDAGGGS